MKQTILIALLVLHFSNPSQAQQQPNFKQITTTLEQAYERDQSIRERFAKTPMNTPEYKIVRDSLRYIDSTNQAIVFPILEQYNWLKSNVTSKNASAAFYYVIQHAELPAQIKYARYMDEAYKAKEISHLDYARFVDRLLFRQGKFQRYGLQQASDPLGNVYCYPMKNIEEVNKQRASLGFGKVEDDVTAGSIVMAPGVEQLTHPNVFIGHVSNDSNFKEPAENVEILLNGTVIGKTNAKGFVYIALERPYNEEVTLTIQRGAKSQNFVLKGEKDFFEYWGVFKP
ncbi:DUF6624 domain-containing protein [Chitinophaga skermanii]|nr:DUF6624 domain-containing protein [Chitinophaga skermanii]